MPRIKCHYFDCVFIDDGYCGSATVEIDPDMGCMTFKRASDVEAEDDWEDDENSDMEDWEDLDIDDDEMWMDEEY